MTARVECSQSNAYVTSANDFCADWIRAHDVHCPGKPMLQGSVLVSCGMCSAFISDLGSHLEWHRKLKTK